MMLEPWRIRQVRETRGVFNADVALSGLYFWRLDQCATEVVQAPMRICEAWTH